MMLMMMERMMNCLESEGDGSGNLDGLRVNRALGRLRGFKKRMREEPVKVVDEFYDYWQTELGAEEKPWTWEDVADEIAWGKLLSLKRCFVMIGACLRLNRAKRYSESSAQMVQCLKALGEMAAYQDWKVVWPLTHLADPITKTSHTAPEPELEAVLTKLKVESDLNRTLMLDKSTDNDQANAWKKLRNNQ